MPAPQTREKVRERFWRLQNLYLVKDKKRRLSKMRFNPCQERIAGVVEDCLVRGVPIQHMDLKSRQIGASTWWGAFYLDDTVFTRNTNTFVVAQKRETLKLLWEMLRLMHRGMPDAARPKLTDDNANTLTFGHINSTIKVSLSVKSVAAHNLMVSEYALCDPEEIEQTLAACPPDANITLETVADGVNHAYDKWQEKKDGWTRIFHPWYMVPEYQIPVPAPLERTPAEGRLAGIAQRDHGVSITDEQLAFRRKKHRDLKRRAIEQFPEDEVSCFLSSGNSYFDGRKAKMLLSEAEAHLEAHPPAKQDDEWLIVETPQPRHIYVAGADVAEGVGEDSSVLAVLCVTCRQTAARYKARCGVDSFYRTCYEVGLRYNRALLAPELNNHGHAVVMGLREKNYPNLYRKEAKNRTRKTSGQESVKFGWETTPDSKPVMMDHLKIALEGDSEEDEENFEPGLLWLDVEFLKETLGIREQGGKIGAVAGKHDDLTMAYAIAWQMLRRADVRSAAKVIGGIRIAGTLESA